MAREKIAVGLLEKVRSALVEERRTLVDNMLNSPHSSAAVFGPGFTSLQSTIESVDRALADERSLGSASG
jgi:hypothetical protein